MKTVNLTDEEHQELLAKRAAKEAAKASEAKRQDMVRAEAVTASGTSEGVKKSWETRAREHMSEYKDAPSEKHEMMSEFAHATALKMHESGLKEAGEGMRRIEMYHTARKSGSSHGEAADKAMGAVFASEPTTVTAAGTSEGVKKSWEKRRHGAYDLSNAANEASSKAAIGMQPSHLKSQADAAQGHLVAEEAHKNLAEDMLKEGMTASAGMHTHMARYHRQKWDEHAAHLKASEQQNRDIIHCRDYSAASKLSTSEAWEVGKPVKFMWMPAGVHTILAGFRNGSIELTVNCTPDTVSRVQASLDEWRIERPKQEPFGCIEHREQEASVRVTASCGFEWGSDGITISAEPTSLGTNNVNGRIHRSWSPSFETDAEYSRATEVNGVLKFPEGVRGSRSNPAQITGVDFCVGTLTNKPAFHAMAPVKSSEATVTAAGTSEGAKKGWEDRRKAMPETPTLHPVKNRHSLYALRGTVHSEILEEGGDSGYPEIKKNASKEELSKAHAEARDRHIEAAGHYRGGMVDFHEEMATFHDNQVVHHGGKSRENYSAKAAEAKAAATPATILAEYTPQAKSADEIIDEIVQAAWSDEAREAAAESRRQNIHVGSTHKIKQFSAKNNRDEETHVTVKNVTKEHNPLTGQKETHVHFDHDGKTKKMPIARFRSKILGSEKTADQILYAHAGA